MTRPRGPESRRRRIRRALPWIGVYVALVTAPLFVMLLGPSPPGRGFWWEFSTALGFSAAVMMGIQFVLTARFRRASAPFGADILYAFHRYLGVVAGAIVFAHWAILRIRSPETLVPVDPLRAPFHLTAGRLSLLLLAAILATSLWRRKFRLEYERWRLFHLLMSVLALVLALVHIEGAAYHLTTPLKRIIWTAYGFCWLLLVVHVRVLKPWGQIRKPYRVASVRPEGDRTWTVEVRPEGHGGLRFEPGQFAWVTFRASPFRFREHPFSFSSSAERKGSLEFTIKELGDFTQTVKDLRPGEPAYVDGPYGLFTIDRHPDAPGFVLVAGGVGIAPIASMLRTMRDRGDRRPVYLFYGSPRAEGAPFREEISRLPAEMNLTFVHVLEHGPAGGAEETGYVDRAILERRLPGDRREFEYFLCGPDAMRDAVEAALLALGVPPEQIHEELFEWV
ncbi:MAG: ferredoxin reductase family protein [Planctomycetes bacterium]|nr:ferredoxin reductase family protein [Planctomycetota bacterium]